MNSKIRYAAFSIVGISIVLTQLLAYPEVSRSRARARSPITTFVSRIGGMDDKNETTFRPPPQGLKTWAVRHEWHNNRWNCPVRLNPDPDDVPAGQVLVDYINDYDGGSGPLPCEWNSKIDYRGTIWFDLSEIYSKPSPQIADKATLRFKKVAGSVAAYDGNRKPITRVCEDQLFVANA